MNVFNAAFVALFLTLCVGSPTEEDFRDFSNREGRTIRAKLESATADKVTVRLTSGKTYTLELNQLSDSDQEYVRDYLGREEAKEDARARAEHADEARAKVLEFAESHLGKPVGNGECWTLANQAYVAAKISRPGGDQRVWGREIDYEKEEILPGDIIEIKEATFTGGLKVPNQHTAIICKATRRGDLEVLEQNTGGRKFVTRGAISLRALESGTVRIYRYE
ncbi:SH3 domain-containing protein [Haloferula helveola]|uniref:SH3 domain-containing protein n=1 Tax=Haloferula helveola TaxID=490095 RepID=A0ABN6H3W9_9BACT|nr:SH3 domain-containing protein [Haloferula helveola]